MVIGEIVLSVEFLTAILTLIVMARLLLEAPFLKSDKSIDRCESYGSFTTFFFKNTSQSMKRSLLNQHVAPRI